MHDSRETLAIGWCDDGTTDGKFTEGLVYTILASPAAGLPVARAIRVQGHQIARQRQALLDLWADDVRTDWLLWVDSDVVLTLDVLQKLWQAADATERPVVSGTYFISKENEGSAMMPMPALFDETDGRYAYRHPLPENALIRVDAAGFGLLLMHRSIVAPMRQRHPGQSLFGEIEAAGDAYASEDIQFCRRLKATGIPLHAHTGAVAKHMKRYALDAAYYRLYWNAAAAQQAPGRGS